MPALESSTRIHFDGAPSTAPFVLRSPELTQLVDAATTAATLEPLVRHYGTEASRGALDARFRHELEAEWAQTAADQFATRAVEHRGRAACRREALGTAGRAVATADGAKAGLYLMLAFIGIVAEFGLTISTLPWALSLPARSVLGIAIALAPTCATLILDEVFHRLIPSDDVQATSRFARWWRQAVRFFFWAAIAALVYLMLAPMAPVREASGRTMRDLQGMLLAAQAGDETGELQTTYAAVDAAHTTMGAHAAMDASMVSSLVRWVTFTVAVTSALFFMLGNQAWFVIRQHRKLKKEVRALDAEQENLDMLAATHKALATSLRAALARVENVADLDAKRFQDQQLFSLGQALDRLHASQSAESRVEALLNQKFQLARRTECPHHEN